MRLRIVTILCGLVVLGYVATFARGWGAPGGWIVDDKGEIQLVDHLSLWAAGRLARDGHAAQAYDVRRHEQAMEHEMGRPATERLPYSYPPQMFLATALTAGLPYLFSVIAWSTLTTLALGLVGAAIIGQPAGGVWILATVPVFWNFACGQTGALAAALLGAAMLFLSSRPLLAGVLIGLLTIKPHLGLLLPVVLVAGGHWRTLGAAVLTTLGLAGLTATLFGIEPWLAFPAAMSRFGAFVLSDDNITAFKLQSLFGALVAVGLPARLAVACQTLLALAMLVLAWSIWRRPAAPDLKAGTIVAATALVSPYFFSYDLVALSVAQAFLIRHMLTHGVGERDVLVLVLVNTLVALITPLGLPVGFLASVVMFGALLHRMLNEPLASRGNDRSRVEASAMLAPQPAGITS